MSFTVINVSEQRFDGANDLNKRTPDYPLHDEETEFDDNRCSMQRENLFYTISGNVRVRRDQIGEREIDDLSCFFFFTSQRIIWLT